METNATYQYWDSMDGDAMVCSQLGPPGYRGMCNFNQYVLGILFTIYGVAMLYNSNKLVRMAGATVVPVIQDLPAAPRRRTKKTSYINKRFTYVVGVELVGIGLTHLVGGSGTVHSSSTLVGLFGDFFFSVVVALNLYHSLLQLQGAKAFSKLVELPTFSGNMDRHDNIIIQVLDTAQSAGAFPITFGFWLLLANGIIKRSEYYSAFSILMGCAGIRSMIQNILERVRTLVRVDELQQNAGGNIDAKYRRRHILRTKARVLILHMLGIIWSNVLFPLSVLIVGSVNSSTQILVHNGVTNTAVVNVLLIIWYIFLHKTISKSWSKRSKSRRNRMHTLTNFQSASTVLRKRSEPIRQKQNEQYTIANESGMSVVNESEFGGKTGDGSSPGGGGGLFTEAQSKL